jgi:AcrR family transcriptional regulator
MGRKAVDKTRYKNEQAKEKLVVKAMVYFQHNGTKKTMSKMAKDLVLSKTTIYNHFNTKQELVIQAIKFKLTIINDYKSVLDSTSLPYIERYRKAMLFFCVQIFDVSSVFLSDIENDFPNAWKLIEEFQHEVYKNLTHYYQEGIEKKVFKPTSPELLTVSDQYFFTFLSTQIFLKKHEISVLDAFKQHYQTKFFGILNEGKTRSF